MKKLLLSALLLHATATMHFAQANGITETISSTASLLFSAKVLIPVTLGAALYFNLAQNAKLSYLNSHYRDVLRQHGFSFDWNRRVDLSKQPGCHAEKMKELKTINEDLMQRAITAETQNKIYLAAFDALKTNNADALIKTFIQKK